MGERKWEGIMSGGFWDADNGLFLNLVAGDVCSVCETVLSCTFMMYTFLYGSSPSGISPNCVSNLLPKISSCKRKLLVLVIPCIMGKRGCSQLQGIKLK